MTSYEEMEFDCIAKIFILIMIFAAGLVANVARKIILASTNENWLDQLSALGQWLIIFLPTAIIFGFVGWGIMKIIKKNTESNKEDKPF